MILRSTRSARINMGNYEHMEMYATVEIDTEKDEISENEAKPLIQQYLTDMLQHDMVRVSQLTDNEKSFVFPYLELIAQEKAPVKSSRKVTRS